MALLATSGCSALQAPLGDIACVDAGHHDDAVYGIVVTNKGSRDITLTSVELHDAEGVSLEGSWVVPPDSGGGMLGSWHHPADDYPRWSDRAAIDGFELQTGDTANIVVLLRREPGVSRAEARSQLIRYQDEAGLPFSTISRETLGFDFNFGVEGIETTGCGSADDEPQ